MSVLGSIASITSLVIALYFQWQGKPGEQRNIAVVSGAVFIIVTSIAYLQRRKTKNKALTQSDGSAMGSHINTSSETLSGEINVHLPSGSLHEVFYKRPFIRRPHLEVKPLDSRYSGFYEITEQRQDGFKITSWGISSLRLNWKAEGQFEEADERAKTDVYVPESAKQSPKILEISQSRMKETHDNGELRSLTQHDSANKYFLGNVFDDLTAARKVAIAENIPIFMVVYDSHQSEKSRIDYFFRWFMEYRTTRELVRDNFVQALVDANNSDVAQYIPTDNPLEHCLLIVLTPDGKVVRREDVPGNPDDALRWVRKVVAK